jgi:hypothetical protein
MANIAFLSGDDTGFVCSPAYLKHVIKAIASTVP